LTRVDAAAPLAVDAVPIAATEQALRERTAQAMCYPGRCNNPRRNVIVQKRTQHATRFSKKIWESGPWFSRARNCYRMRSLARHRTKRFDLHSPATTDITEQMKRQEESLTIQNEG